MNNPRKTNHILVRVMRDVRNAELDYYLPIRLATEYKEQGLLFLELNNGILCHTGTGSARLNGALDARSK